MKALLDLVLDVVIPEGEGFPSARSLDSAPHGVWPGEEPVQALVGALPSDFSIVPHPVRISVLETLERRQPETFADSCLRFIAPTTGHPPCWAWSRS